MTCEVKNCVKQRRRKAGMTMTELGDQCGLTKQTIFNIEHGKGAKIETFQKIAKSLGCTVDELLI